MGPWDCPLSDDRARKPLPLGAKPASPTITFAPIRASSDLISTSCLKHPFRPCQAPHLTTIAGVRLLSVTTTVTSKDFRNFCNDLGKIGPGRRGEKPIRWSSEGDEGRIGLTMC